MANHPKFSLLECAFWIPADWPQGLRQTLGNDRDRMWGQCVRLHFDLMDRFFTLWPAARYWFGLKSTDGFESHAQRKHFIPLNSRLVQIISQQHMLHFTFHLWLLMHSALGQSRPACQHVMADLWAKGTAASSLGFLKNADPSQCRAPLRCEHAHSVAHLTTGTSLDYM